MNYMKIDTEDLCNGDGLRVVLWLSGCSHHCYNCQNPQTWNPASGILFDKSAEEELFRELSKDYISGLTLTGGDPLHENNIDEVLNLVNKFRLLFGDTKTIWLYTGYDADDFLFYKKPKLPNINKDFLKELAKCQKSQGIVFDNKYRGSITQTALRNAIAKQCNVLIDGRYIDSKRDITLQWRGSSNQRVIDIQKSLKGGEIVLWNS